MIPVEQARDHAHDAGRAAQGGAFAGQNLGELAGAEIALTAGAAQRAHDQRREHAEQRANLGDVQSRGAGDSTLGRGAPVAENMSEDRVAVGGGGGAPTDGLSSALPSWSRVRASCSCWAPAGWAALRARPASSKGTAAASALLVAC